MSLTIVGIGERLHILVPAPLVSSDIIEEPRQDRLFVSFRFTVCLRAIRGGFKIFLSKERTQDGEELSNKLRTIFLQ